MVLRAVLPIFAAVLVAAGMAQAAEWRAELVRMSDAVFARPHDLTLSPDARFLYVSDLGHDAVKVLDPTSLEVIGVIGEDQVSSPHDVAFDSAGRLLVADTGNDRVAIYAVDGASGTLVAEYAESLSNPEGVTVGPHGRVYVTNVGDHNVVVFADGKVVASAGGYGDEPGQFSRPHDIEANAQGRLFVGDPGNDRIQVLTPDLRVLQVLQGPAYGFNQPKYLGLDGQGRLYVADQHNDLIRFFDNDYRQVGAVGTGRRGDGPDQFDRPEGVEVLGERMWISDTYNHRIKLYRLNRSR